MSRKSRSSSSSESLVCPRCATRYGLDERFCGQCGLPLVYAGPETREAARDDAHERARKIDPRYAEGDLVRVAHAMNQAEAELVQNMLIEEGIPSMLRRSGGFDVPDFLAAGPRDVVVPRSGAAAARDTLLAADMEQLAVSAPDPPTRRQTAIVAAAVAGGALIAALVAWALQQGGG